MIKKKFSKLSILGIIFIGITLLAQITIVTNSSIFHDEYIYSAGAQYFTNFEKLASKKLVDTLPNTIYLFIYSFTNFFSENWYFAARLINIIFFLLAAIPIAAICSMTGIPQRLRPVAIAIALILPYSTYTKYFMPEPLYFTGFMAVQALLMRSILSSNINYFSFCGAAIGILYFVKPHAATILATSATVILIYTIKNKEKILDAIVKVIALVGGFISILIAVKIIIEITSISGGEKIYQDMGGGGIQHLATLLRDEPLTLANRIAYVFSNHLLFIGILFSLPIAISLLKILDTKQRESAPSLLALIALTNLTALLCMSVLFTIGVNEVGRIHTRYYGFVFSILCVCLLFSENLEKEKFQIRALISGISIVAIISGILLQDSLDPIIKIATLSDAPEIAINRLDPWTIALVCAPSVISAVLLLLGNQSWRFFAIAYIFVFSLVDVAILTKLNITSFNQSLTRGTEAKISQAYIPPSERHKVLVIASNRDELSKFLFHFREATYWRYLSSGTTINETELPHDVRWIIILKKNAKFIGNFNTVVSLTEMDLLELKK